MKKVVIIFMILVFAGASWAKYKLTLNFSGFTPHIGQPLKVRVVDNATELEVGRYTVPVVGSDAFNVDMYVQLPEHTYTVDIFADVNLNGEYDAPPTDHAWRIENVAGNVDDIELDVVHNTNFTDIEYPAPLNLAYMDGAWDGFWDNPTYNVSNTASGTAIIDGPTMNVNATGKAWGIFGNPDAVEYTFDGAIGPESFAATVNAHDPWQGAFAYYDGQITGGIAYQSIGITATVVGNYGPGQMIYFYHMVGAFDAIEFAVLTREFNMPVETLVRQNKNYNTLTDFVLYDNYPNPFNPQTTIYFNVPEQAQVKIDVFDVTGRKVNTLVDATFDAGQHQTIWHANNSKNEAVSSGIYFYQMTASSGTQTFSQIKKMSHVK